ncbi:MAG: PH domain-containing protein [Syntrophomonadaceae bacterium]|nr:PH domain-containing protein [Syntrophomonadaceae bacterium]
MEFRPTKASGIIYGLIMGIVIFGFCFWGIDFSLGPNDRTLKIMLYIPAYLFLFIYLVLVTGLFNMTYRVEEDGLLIKWGIARIKIAWDEISNINQITGKSNMSSLFGSSWYGYMIGLYTVNGIGAVRMFATFPEKGFIYLKTSRGFYGLTPADPKLIDIISERSGIYIDTVHMDELDPEIKGTSMQDDSFYRILLSLNIFFLCLFAAYLAIFFPGSGAPPFVVLLLVLAVALFFFSIGNAGRLYQFSQNGGYMLLLLGLAVTGIFLILSLSEISLR